MTEHKLSPAEAQALAEATAEALTAYWIVPVLVTPRMAVSATL